jgi:chromosome segregation ATPase
MDQQKNEFEQAAFDAQTKLDELERELAEIPALIKTAAAQTIEARDEETILQRIQARKRLEERKEVLPILIRHARIAVLKARAEIHRAKSEAARAVLPDARAEEAEAKTAFEAAETRYRTAKELTQRLGNTADGARNRMRLLLDDADNLTKDKPTNHYFTNN